MPKVNLNLLSENTKNINDKSDEENENNSQEEEKSKANKKIKKRRKSKKKSQVQVHVEMSNTSDQSIINKVNSPLKNFRKSSNESKKSFNNNYIVIPNQKINHTEVFNKSLKNKPLLIITNKQDLPQAYSSEEIANILGLYYFKDIKWYIRGTSCVNGEGVNECLDWVIDNMTNDKIENNNSSSVKKSK